MRVNRLTLREIHLKLLTPFETSMDRVSERRIILAEVQVDNVSGWGECTAGETPYYCPEDTEKFCVAAA
jgi:O-succinylbenzoate synthase